MELSQALGAMNWAAVVVAAVVTFVIGGVWYSPLLFARQWMALNQLSEDDLKAGSAVTVFGTSFVFALVASVVLAMFLGPTANLAFGATAGLLVGLGWVAPAMGTTFLFERRPMALLAIDAGYHVLTFTLMGAILGAWR